MDVEWRFCGGECDQISAGDEDEEVSDGAVEEGAVFFGAAGDVGGDEEVGGAAAVEVEGDLWFP